MIYNGGETVPRTIFCRNTIISYFITYHSVFSALHALPDLYRSAVICYFVVGIVVGRGGLIWLI